MCVWIRCVSDSCTEGGRRCVCSLRRCWQYQHPQQQQLYSNITTTAAVLLPPPHKPQPQLSSRNLGYLPLWLCYMGGYGYYLNIIANETGHLTHFTCVYWHLNYVVAMNCIGWAVDGSAVHFSTLNAKHLNKKWKSKSTVHPVSNFHSFRCKLSIVVSH